MKAIEIKKSGTRSINSIEIRFTNLGKGKDKTTYIFVVINFDDGKQGVFNTEAEMEMLVALRTEKEAN